MTKLTFTLSFFLVYVKSTFWGKEKDTETKTSDRNNSETKKSESDFGTWQIHQKNGLRNHTFFISRVRVEFSNSSNST